MNHPDSNMSPKKLLVGLISLLLFATGLRAADSSDPKLRLFILSGQSNMAGLKEAESFIPEIEKAFPKDEIVVVKEAVNGQFIYKWYRQWKTDDGTKPPAGIGATYSRLMEKVRGAVKERKPDSITFVWMQGEADAKQARNTDVYENGLIAQLRTDLQRQDTTVVIGRISDFGVNDMDRPGWNKIREIQVAIAESDPRSGWVDTDDLNGRLNALHYDKAGYKTLGERFAGKAVELIQRKQ